jgi:uncharacterized protein
MKKTWSDIPGKILSAWTGLVEKFNFMIILVVISGAVFALTYTVKYLGMNIDTRDMLSPELEWRQLDLKIDKLFPQYTNNILVVIEASTPDEASDAGTLLHERLQNETGLFKFIYYPGGLSFFKTSSLLYLDIDELQDLADNLAAIQPFLSRLTEDQSIRGLYNMLSDAVEAKIDGNNIDLIPIINRINSAFIALDKNQHYRLSWQALMRGDEDNKNVYRDFIVLQPILDYGGLFPAEAAINKIRDLANELRLNPKNNINVRLTGSAVLSHEELNSVSSGMGLSVIVAFCLVAVILIAGLQSVWLVISTIITLITGLIYTAWFATVTVGELNLISVAFAILYIGLGVDFAIHFSLRYREHMRHKQNCNIALRNTTTNIGKSLALCAVTTAIGFYAFIPTDYVGVAELGWISGTGMLISLLITLTLLPALLRLFPIDYKTMHTGGSRNIILVRIISFPITHAGSIKITTAILAIISLIMVSRLQFDHNTLHLQSPKNESVKTFLELLADPDNSPWTSTTLADGEIKADLLDSQLSSLPLVEKVVWLNDLIPREQDEKLGIIEEMDLLLGSITTTTQLPAPNDTERLSSIRTFNHWLKSLLETGEKEPGYQKLYLTINRFLEKADLLNETKIHGLLGMLENSLLGSFPGRLDALLQAMNAENITRDTLPDELKSLWFNNGYYRLEIYPRENLMENEAMRRFVDEIKSEVPGVTGAPVVSIEAGNAVVAAFRQAFSYALIATILLLLILVERKIDAVFILIPLLLAVLFTGAISVLLDIPLNFANIIALPLLLGIGVDSSIHILHRLRSDPPENGLLLATSSARAVVISALTTIFSIGNLAFSPHLGTASMGKLLTIGITMTLICTLIVLPSLLAQQIKYSGKI